MKQLLVTALITSLLIFAPSSQAQISMISVNATGEGPTENDAIKAAQVQAVGQVSGETISASSAMKKQSVEVKELSQNGKKAASAQKRTMDQSIDSATQGMIKSTKVVSMTFNKSTGLYHAEIIAQIPRLDQDPQLNRKRIVVVATERSYSNDAASVDSIRSAIEGGLVNSRKMAILDRNEFASVEKEVNLALSGRAAIEESLKAWNLPIADLMLLIDVQKMFEFKDQVGNPISQIDAKITVIDIASRQVKYQKVTKSLYPGTLSSVAAPLSKMTGVKIANEVLDYAFPVMVLSATGNTLTVSAGNAQLKVGQTVKILKLGKVLKDPYTNEKLGEEEIEVARGKVSSVTPASATVEADNFVMQTKAQYLVRTSKAATESTSNKETTNKSSNDDNW
ncbi:MAG: hypothetical protein RJB18_909 [Pseudomonadota bacterium]|jgi:hypothetical protein